MATKSGKAPVTRAELRQELGAWATEINGSFNAVEERLDENTRRLVAIEAKLKFLDLLEPILTELKAIRENSAAMLSLYRRLDRRTEALADHVSLDLRKVHTEA